MPFNDPGWGPSKAAAAASQGSASGGGPSRGAAASQATPKGAAATRAKASSNRSNQIGRKEGVEAMQSEPSWPALQSLAWFQCSACFCLQCMCQESSAPSPSSWLSSQDPCPPQRGGPVQAQPPLLKLSPSSHPLAYDVCTSPAFLPVLSRCMQLEPTSTFAVCRSQASLPKCPSWQL